MELTTLKEVKQKVLDKYSQYKSVKDTDLYSFLDEFNLKEEDYQEIINFLEAKNIKVISNQINLQENEDYLDSALKMYYKDINKYPLLTKEEEIELAKKISQGDNKSFDKFVNSNLRLVVSVANSFKKITLNNPNISFEDIVSFGNDGLIRAAKKFDYTKGYRFSTMAYPWIRQAIQRGIYTQGYQIKVPSNVGELRTKIVTATNYLTNKNSRAPTYEEIANYIGNGLTSEKVEQVLSNWNNVISLDETVSNGDSKKSILENIIPDNSSNTDSSSQDEIDLALECLNEREKDIVNKRFGLANNSPLTLEQIGNEYNISKERVRQILNRALEKMKLTIEDK